jgi:hypothetical protein
MEARGLRLAIGAILKDEGPYILEWVAYHRVLGVDRFFLADNGAGEGHDDGSAALLAALDRAGIVDRLAFPGEPGRPPQLPAYGEILCRHGADTDWIAFIDADEFLLPAPPRRSLRPVLAAFESRPAAGAVAVNWAVYGSSGETEARRGLVVERFSARDRHDSPLHRHYKTILRPRAFAGLHETPHLFRLLPGTYAVHADGRPVRTVPGDPPGVAETAVWTPLRLNHYVVKSREEFLRRKQPRGRATTTGKRDPAFFAAHDRNLVADPMPDWLVEATRGEKRRLLVRLWLGGWLRREPALLPATTPRAFGEI